MNNTTDDFQKIDDSSEDNYFEQLGLKTQTDKVTSHTYQHIYPLYLEAFRNKPITLFEIGYYKGASYRLYEEYFPKAKIFSMDIKHEMETARGYVFRGDQSVESDLTKVINSIGKADIIIDDGSHIPEHQLYSFYFLFQNMLNLDGVYIIEDIETSYWRPGSDLYGRYKTGYLNVIDYFNKHLHEVNSNYNQLNNPLNIHSITFAENCIIIKKNRKCFVKKDYYFKDRLGIY